MGRRGEGGPTGAGQRAEGDRSGTGPRARGGPSDTRRPGRPLSADAERAMLSTTLRLLGERGYARLTIEAVAAQSGVAKTTIYRRYGDKADLAAAAIAMLRGLESPPDTGSGRGDVLELVRRFQSLMDGPGRRMLATLVAEERDAPELIERFRERLISPSRDQARAVLARAKERGEVRPDADPELVLDMLAGSYFTRHLAGVGVPPDTAERLVDELWRGIGVSRPSRRSRRPSTAPPRR
jgi:AcrR family transcriptional regulator